MTPVSRIPLDVAFQRHPRPQALTSVAHLDHIQSDRSDALSPLKTLTESPWKSLHRLGDLVQGKQTWSICMHREELVMIKKVDRKCGERQLRKIKRLTHHPHVVTVRQMFIEDSWYHFEQDYARYTLEELLNIHCYLEESHIRIIASSVRALIIRS
jgi:hypothetical protein